MQKYRLYLLSYRPDKHTKERAVLRKILPAILGYSHDDIEFFEKKNYACDIAQHLTLEQARQIGNIMKYYHVLPAIALDESVYVGSLGWNDVGGVQAVDPDTLNCTFPLISEEQCIDPVEYYISQTIRTQQEIKARQEREQQPQQNLPKCPTCQSTNIRKIGGLERGTSVFTFGLFSNKINKTFKCNNCGYSW